MKKNIDLSQYEPLFVDTDKILKQRFLNKLLFAVIVLVAVALLSSCSGARGTYSGCAANGGNWQRESFQYHWGK